MQPPAMTWSTKWKIPLYFWVFNSDNFYNAYYKQEMSLFQETVDEKKQFKETKTWAENFRMVDIKIIAETLGFTRDYVNTHLSSKKEV